jgi:DNA-binding phage protein
MLAQHFGTTSRHIYQLLEKEPPPDLNDVLEQVNALTYHLGQKGLQRLYKALKGGEYDEK